MFLTPEENEQETPPNSRKIKFFSKYLNFANSLVHVHTSPMGKRFQEFVINIVISVFMCYDEITILHIHLFQT